MAASTRRCGVQLKVSSDFWSRKIWTSPTPDSLPRVLTTESFLCDYLTMNSGESQTILWVGSPQLRHKRGHAVSSSRHPIEFELSDPRKRKQGSELGCTRTTSRISWRVACGIRTRAIVAGTAATHANDVKASGLEKMAASSNGAEPYDALAWMVLQNGRGNFSGDRMRERRESGVKATARHGEDVYSDYASGCRHRNASRKYH